MITSYIIYTLIFILSLHLSFWPAAWVTFNEDELQLPLFLAATRVSWMLHVSRVKWSFTCIYILRIKSLVHSRAWDWVSLFPKSSFCVSLSLFLSLQKKEVGDGGIWTLTLRVSSRLLTLKTPVPWPVFTNLCLASRVIWESVVKVSYSQSYLHKW